MEKSSLGELKLFLTEDIFLLDEDIESLTKNDSQEIQVQPTQTTSISSSTTNETPTADSPAQEVEVKEPIKVRGKFEKGILILHEESSLADPVMDMLVKMITAVNHSMSEVGLLNSEELEGRTLEEFQAINAHVILKFGRIKHPINALPIHEYQPHTEDETEYLFADSLSMIAEDGNLKRKLWASLKSLFNLA